MRARDMRPYCLEEQERVRAMAEAGKTDPEIAKELGRHPKSIQKLRGRMGVFSRNASFAGWSDSEMQLLEEMFFAGSLDHDIAARLGRSYESVRSKRQALGLDGSAKKAVETVKPVVPVCTNRRLLPCSIEAEFDERDRANRAYLLAGLRAGHPVYFNARGPE